MANGILRTGLVRPVASRRDWVGPLLFAAALLLLLWLAFTCIGVLVSPCGLLPHSSGDAGVGGTGGNGDGG